MSKRKPKRDTAAMMNASAAEATTPTEAATAEAAEAATTDATAEATEAATTDATTPTEAATTDATTPTEAATTDATAPTDDAQPEISVTVLRPGSKGKRSFSVVKGTTWGELMKKFKFSLKDGWRASVGGTLIGDNYVLQDGDGIKLGNQPRNG